MLVSGTDGVGTKLAIALATGIHDFVGTPFVISPQGVHVARSISLLIFFLLKRYRFGRYVCE